MPRGAPPGSGRTAKAIIVQATLRHQRLLTRIASGKKWCPRCERWLQLLDDFGPNRGTADGHRGYCRGCDNAYSRNRRHRFELAVAAAAARVRARVDADRAADDLAARWRRGKAHVPAWQPPPDPQRHRPERLPMFALLADILRPPKPDRWSTRCCSGPFVWDEELGWYRADHTADCSDRRWQPTTLTR